MSKHASTLKDRYIICAVKINGNENGRTEILDTTIDGGEGKPLIVASFFDRHEAIRFCRVMNGLPELVRCLKNVLAYHPCYASGCTNEACSLNEAEAAVKAVGGEA